MASIGQRGNSYFVILSPSENDKRPRISLGRCKKREAQTFKVNIENIIQARKTGASLSAPLMDWVNSLPSAMRQRLVSLDLVEAKTEDVLLLDFAKEFIEAKEKDPYIKKNTTEKYWITYQKMQVFFKGDTLSSVKPVLAKRFRDYLKQNMHLADNTIKKHCRQVKSMFAAAIKQGIITQNPFDDISTNLTADPDRVFFVSPEISQKVLEHCPNAEWRLLFGLARFGGLRIPSELKDLKWQDVRFDEDVFIVRATKTAHHDNRGIRKVPIFPELRTLFIEAFEQAPDGEEYVCPTYRHTNPRTHFYRILNKAGIAPWSKPFHNCRSTRESELVRLTGGNIQAVCSWLGNSPAVALKHYLQTTEEETKSAAAIKVLDDGWQSVSAENRCAHNCAHNLAETTCEVLQDVSSKGDVSGLNCKSLQQKNATLQYDAKWRKTPRVGLEPTT